MLATAALLRQDEPMPTEQERQAQEGFAAQLMQIAPWVKRAADAVKPLFDQPVIRFPYVMPLASSLTIAANTRNVVLNSDDFQQNLEFPFEVHAMKFAQDAAHTFRDWSVSIQDQTFNQAMQKNAWKVADVVDDDTGKWALKPYPWVIRPKGGGVQVTADNLDTVNGITIDFALIGYLMIPK